MIARMDLRRFDAYWNALGRRDPFSAILLPGARAAGWDADEFFATGVAEIDAVLTKAGDLGLSVPRRRALDFGCGVGRLTQAMARHFDRADGVDVSPSMLDLARQHNQHGERCVYHENGRPNLSLFEDGSFTFAYSVLVLQHMEPRYSHTYIRELLRVLAPGGLLVFQVPSRSMPLAGADDAAPGAHRSNSVASAPNQWGEPWSSASFCKAICRGPTRSTAPASTRCSCRRSSTSASVDSSPCSTTNSSLFSKLHSEVCRVMSMTSRVTSAMNT